SMPWYSEAGGKTLLAHLETLPIAQDRNLENFRFPVQFVQRPNLNYRGFAGQIASGSVKRGDDVLVLPSRRKSRVKAIDTFSGEVEQAFAPMSVTVRLEDEVDVSRGDMLVHASDLPEVTQDLRAMLVWMSETALDVGKSYFIKHASQYVRARVDAVAWAMDLETLQQQPAQTLGLNEIGCVQLRTHRPVFFDPYTQNRATGAFVVIDSITNDTVAAGMIVEAGPRAVGGTSEQETQVSTTERERQLGHQAALIELRGDRERARRLAFALERVLFDRGQLAVAVADPEPLAPASAQEVCARLLGLGARVIFVGALEPERTTLSALGARRTRVAVSGDAQALELAVDTKSADLEALALDLIERMAVAGAL